jgi:hypothetical protein
MKSLTFVDGNLPKFLGDRRPSGSLTSARQGVQGSFAVVGFRGKVWRTKFRGNEEVVRDAQNQPAQSLDVVVVGVADSISKTYYAQGYVEGDDNAPDCFSLDNVTPDPSAPKKQSAVCATCPQNQFGSRMTQQGKRAKACSDARRIAVVPLGDIDNEQLGGPMLLRLPPMTLSSFARYADELERKGVPDIWNVGTRLAFDLDVAYQRITFEPIRWVSEQEDTQIAVARQNPLIDNILYNAAPTESAPAAAADGKEIPGTPLHKGATVTRLPARAQQAPPPGEPEEEDEEDEEENKEEPTPAPTLPPAARAVKPSPFQPATRQRRAPQLQPQPATAPAGLEDAIDDLLDEPA